MTIMNTPKRHLKLGLAILATMATAFCLSPASAQTLTSNETGAHNGYFYSFWTDAPGTVSMTMGAVGTVVADWTLSTNDQNYTYIGTASGNVDVEFDNDATGHDVIVDYVTINGENRQAEDMEYNTATYVGECGGGSYSDTMHCNGVIGFGHTDDCFSGNCN